MYHAQKCFAFLLMMPLAASAMEPVPKKDIYDEQKWSQCTHKVTKDPKTGEKTYVGTYEVDVPQGLVKVKTASYRDLDYDQQVSLLWRGGKCDAHITVDRHTKQYVVVTAVLAKKIAEERDLVERDDYHFKKFGLIWIPWRADVVRHPDDLNVGVSRIKLRGHNRLSIEIREPGNYHIMLPEDADIEVKTVGNIDYKSALPTLLYARSKTVNRQGDGGFIFMSPNGGVVNGSEWHYDYANSKDPSATQTRLIAKTGHINVPEKPKL